MKSERVSPLTNEEKETIISFDETKEPAVIFTYNKAWQKHLEGRLGLKPIRDNRFGGKEYEIPKSRIRKPQAPRKMSEEQKQKATERLTKARLSKSPDRVKRIH
jgi:hypothetical protein